MSNGGPLPSTVVSGSETTPVEVQVPFWPAPKTGSWWRDLLIGLAWPSTVPAWRVKKTFCNETNQPITVLIADNPWRTGPGNHYQNKLFPGKDKNGEFENKASLEKAKAAGKTITLQPKGSAGDCKTLTYDYPWKPTGMYVDLFKVEPDGSSSDKPLIGSYTGRSEPLYARLEPENGHPTFAAVIPLPYPMSVESATEDPIDVVVDRVEGLPGEFELLATFPPIGKPHRLDPGDRMSECVVIVRQHAPMKENRVTVTAYQRVVSPEAVADWPERAVRFDIANLNVAWKETPEEDTRIRVEIE